MVTSCHSWITSDIISDSNLNFQCVKRVFTLDLVTKMERKYYSVWVSFCPRAVWVSFCPRGPISLTPITTMLSTRNTTPESNGL